MQIIRLQRIGKKHVAEYRLVVAEKTRHVSKLAAEILGHYNPRTKVLALRSQEKVQKYLDLNTAMSDTVKSLLKKNNFVVDKVKVENKATTKVSEPKKEATPATKVTKKVAKKATTTK